MMKAEAAIRRPALRYHGGKWMLAPWIISHMPEHRIYVEPFGGGASVLLRKPRSYAEIYNDLDCDIVNFFKVLRDRELGRKLIDKLRLTPFSRDEFKSAYGDSGNAVENARRLLIRSFMGFGSDGHNDRKPTGFRANSNRPGTTPAHDWANLGDAHLTLIDRLQGVVIENRPAMQVCTQHDGPDTLHYLDPPYVTETRAADRNKGQYKFEMTDADHISFLESATELSGMVMISGYNHPLYESALSDWARIDRVAFADGARKRTESLWLNYDPKKLQPQPDMFDA